MSIGGRCKPEQFTVHGLHSLIEVPIIQGRGVVGTTNMEDSISMLPQIPRNVPWLLYQLCNPSPTHPSGTYEGKVSLLESLPFIE